ncbi:MAG: hypothetical protein P0Y49_17195 [Candidatus Pedobacter colombiensis]|uniref:Uncharacterized protein n=1 Tax=Candidatus Pedobacter colombiensis TaxID=3121371 RepID=A0AAJ6B7Y1_9SPHI|nr:hypothetical protein [Pedobacter sp.]WEK18528.1 MAG: hypothetical protein P0Y49_17195 [Pedobacter sp.]
MNTSAKQLWTKLQQIGSYLLIALFLFISIAQLFHLHIDVHENQEALYGDNERIQLSDKCTVCDYSHHVQGQQILLSHSQVLTITSPEAITLNTRVLTGFYDFTPQVTANKGPPH